MPSGLTASPLAAAELSGSGITSGNVDALVQRTQAGASLTSGVSSWTQYMSSAPGSASAPARVRERFDAEELRSIAARYDIGKIKAIHEFRRGSSRAPKVIIQTDRAKFLLKRRALAMLGAGGVARVHLCHAVQAILAARKFPLPPLIPTRDEWITALESEGYLYELFALVEGGPYDAGLDGASDAGMLLAGFHALLVGRERELERQAPLSRASYHRARGLHASLDTILQRLGEPVRPAVDALRARADDAAARVDSLGLAQWPAQVAHGDWHPGNMLFRRSRAVAVIDYDTVRLLPRIIDAANGALQFSLSFGTPASEQGGSPTPSDPAARWSRGLDEARFKRFFRGYEAVRDSVLSRAEIRAVPWLMIEALVVEAAAPIAATGRFAHLDGAPILRVVASKVDWLAANADRLVALIGE